MISGSAHTPPLQLSPAQHSAPSIHDAPTDLQSDGMHSPFCPPLQSPVQQSALLAHGEPAGEQTGSGAAQSHRSPSSTLSSGRQIPQQQSSGTPQGSPSPAQSQWAHVPPTHRPLQQSASAAHASL
jgi:hypothetical protein